MNVPLKSVCIMILERGKEVSIASTIFKLRIGVDKELGIRSDIYVIDNGSRDETAYIANKAGAGVIRYKKRKLRDTIIKKSVALGVKKGHELTVILDRMGGNYAEDAIRLIRAAKEQGGNFATGYLMPVEGDDTIGCVALDRIQLKKLNDRGEEVGTYLFSLSRKENLKKVTFNETIEMVSKKKEISKAKHRPLRERFRNLRRNHPLKFYGVLGFLVLLNSLGFGFYTVDYFYVHQHLYYPTTFATVLLLMIAGFLLVAALMLNALNVMVDKIKSTKKWEKEKASRDRRVCE